MENYRTISIALLIGVVVLFACCIILFVLLYQSKSENSILTGQIEAITADHAAEMTFKTIDDDLRNISQLLINLQTLITKQL